MLWAHRYCSIDFRFAREAVAAPQMLERIVIKSQSLWISILLRSTCKYRKKIRSRVEDDAAKFQKENVGKRSVTRRQTHAMTQAEAQQVLMKNYTKPFI